MLQVNLGLARAAAGNMQGALGAFQRAADLRPELVEAHYLLGSVHFQTGNLLVARPSLERAIALRPEFFDALAQLGVVLARLGHLEDAATMFRRAIVQSPYHADIHVNLANVLRQQGQAAGAEAEYRRAVTLAPDGAMPAYILGAFLAECGRREEAKPVLERCTRLAPNALEPWLALGELANATGDHALAEKCFANALQLERGSEAAWLGAIDAERRRKAWERAEQLSLQAIAALPASMLLRRARASLYFERDDFQGALAVLVEAENAGLGTAPVLAARAAVLRRLGARAEAESVLRAALELDPRDPDALNELAALRLDEENVQAALPVLEGLLGYAPRYAPALGNLGLAYSKLGRHVEALEKFEAAVREAPDNADFLNNLAEALFTSGNVARAIACCEQALRLAPKHPGATSNLALLRFENGEASVAREVVARGLAAQPDDPELVAASALIAFREGRLDQALPALESLAARRPDKRFLSGVLAPFLLAKGRFTEAWRAYAERDWRVEEARKTPLTAPDIALADDLRGKEILILGEQGLGDELFFLRWACFLRERGASLLYRGDGRLHGLLQHLADPIPIANDDYPLSKAHYIFLVGDLPLVTNTPVAPPLLLQPDPVRQEKARQALAAAGPAPYYGITWRAGVTARERRERFAMRPTLYKECPLDAVASGLIGAAGTLVVLQRNAQVGEVDRLRAAFGGPVIDRSECNEDLDDMLALLSELDRYVGVSNTNMHLAAGLRAAASVLVPFPPEWRWGTEAAGSPWFPGFSVLRQTPDGSWELALAALKSLRSAQ